MQKPAEQIVATILGCGSSGGVPRIGNVWGACDPGNPKNRRRRCSLLITGTSEGASGKTQVLIDTGCDIREQLLDAGVNALDAVFYSHEHADHTHGIDDLRVLALNGRKRVDVYFSAQTGQRLHKAFGYCFTTPPGSAYPPILNAHNIEAGQALDVVGAGGKLHISTFAQIHGDINSLGFRIGGFAYSCDLSALPQASHKAVSGLDMWVVDALRPTPHPSHLSLPQTLEIIEKFMPKQAVLTNMHIDLDYEATMGATPHNVFPAYDGMQIDVKTGRILQENSETD